MIKNILLAILSVIILAVATLQDMGTSGDFIAEGSRVFVFIESAGIIVMILGVISGLYMIPEGNRNITSFLKAFVMLGLLLILGRCEQWVDKFHGPDKPIADESSGLSATVPSDWFVWSKKPDNVNLMVMDWAGTRSVSIVVLEPTEGTITKEDITEEFRVLEERVSGTYGEKTGRCDCGEKCTGGIFNTTVNEQLTQLCLAIKHEGGYWLLMSGGAMSSTSDGWEETQRVMSSVKYQPKVAISNPAPEKESIPLFLAASQNHIDVVKQLVSQGEDINQKDQDGNTVLIYAFQYEEETIHELLGMGANVNTVGAKGKTPLISAAAANNFMACQIFIEKGANVNDQDLDGYTALSYASLNRNVALAQSLIDAGADINIKVGSQSLLQIATSNNDYDMIVLLTKYGAKP